MDYADKWPDIGEVQLVKGEVSRPAGVDKASLGAQAAEKAGGLLVIQSIPDSWLLYLWILIWCSRWWNPILADWMVGSLYVLGAWRVNTILEETQTQVSGWLVFYEWFWLLWLGCVKRAFCILFLCWKWNMIEPETRNTESPPKSNIFSSVERKSKLNIYMVSTKKKMAMRNIIFLTFPADKDLRLYLKLDVVGPVDNRPST